MPRDLPYRPNVGAVLFNRDGLVFIGRRAPRGHTDQGVGAWQFPQGGLDKGEDPRVGVFRELAEEIGTDRAQIIAEVPGWLTYDLPPELVGAAWKGKWRGQTQKWFALRFLGEDADIRLDAETPPEFDAWAWVRLAETPALAVGFKRPIYERVAQEFSPLAAQ